MGFLDATPEEFDRIGERTKVLVAHHDADTLRLAAKIMRGRSSKPDGLAMRVLCRLLNDQADQIARGA